MLSLFSPRVRKQRQFNSKGIISELPSVTVPLLKSQDIILSWFTEFYAQNRFQMSDIQDVWSCRFFGPLFLRLKQ